MAEDKKDELKLSAAINGKYKNVNHEAGAFHFKGMNYDFRTMTAETAQKLVEAKCKYIEKVGTVSSALTPKQPGS